MAKDESGKYDYNRFGAKGSPRSRSPLVFKRRS
jgi:hypothetical protein